MGAVPLARIIYRTYTVQFVLQNGLITDEQSLQYIEWRATPTAIV